MTANRQPPTANHDEKNYIILGFFSTKVEPLRLSPNIIGLGAVLRARHKVDVCTVRTTNAFGKPQKASFFVINFHFWKKSRSKLGDKRSGSTFVLKNPSIM